MIRLIILSTMILAQVIAVSLAGVGNVSAFSFLGTATSNVGRVRSSKTSLKSVESPNTAEPPESDRNVLNRRSLLLGLATLSANVVGGTMVKAEEISSPSLPPLESLYFGVGCFWHIQHEFIVAERELLGRSDRELTAFTGYAGGTSADKFGRVCYHNFQNVADYGKYGHGEVVGMKLPTDKIVDFAKVYFSLFNPKTLDRVDPQDRGGEYRSLIGLSGGTSHPLYPAIEEAAANAGFKLEAGKGNDPDTLGKRLVYIYDTATYPFYQAEIYHQFHNDFQSPAYGATYNKLADLAFADGRIQTTGCPDKV